MSDFPKMLYRPGTEIEWSGLNLDTCIVDDEASKAAANAEGWGTAADVFTAKSANDAEESTQVAEAPRRGRPPKTVETETPAAE
jgi:hypothetical protein